MSTTKAPFKSFKDLPIGTPIIRKNILDGSLTVMLKLNDKEYLRTRGLNNDFFGYDFDVKIPLPKEGFNSERWEILDWVEPKPEKKIRGLKKKFSCNCNQNLRVEKGCCCDGI